MATTLAIGRIVSRRPAPPAYECCWPAEAATEVGTEAALPAAPQPRPFAQPVLRFAATPGWLDRIGTLAVLVAVLGTMAVAGAQW